MQAYGLDKGILPGYVTWLGERCTGQFWRQLEIYRAGTGEI